MRDVAGEEVLQGLGRDDGERRFRRFAEVAARGEPVIGGEPVADVEPVARGDQPRVEPATVPLLEEPGEAIAAKPFIGPNATFYDDRWRWMDWRGRRHGWNWPAATTFGVWLAYRKMYRWSVVYLALFSLLVLLAAGGMPVRVAGVLFIIGHVVLGTYANTLYFQHFRSMARVVGNHHADYRTTVAALATAGGVDPAGARLMATSLVGVTGVILGLGALTGSLRLAF